MTLRKTTISLAGCLLAIGSMVTAQASDFTFHMDVDVSGIMPGPSVGVYCHVYANDDRMIGEHLVSLPLDRSYDPTTGTYGAGSFRGRITNSFNAIRGRDPNAATRYECHLNFIRGGGGGPPRASGLPDYATPRPGTTFVPSLRGTLYR